MSQGMVRLFLFCVLGLLLTGCAGSQGGKVQLPADAKMLAYGRYIPATYVPDEPGLLYYVDAGSGEVIHVMSTNGHRNQTPLAAEQLPESMKSNFDQGKQYRVYFVPQTNNPTIHQTPGK